MNALIPIPTRQTVEVVHDFVCPWCFLGVRRLLSTLKQRPALAVELVWQPFLLNPDMPPEGWSRQDYAIRKYGGEDRARRLHATIAELGLQSGIVFRFDRIRRIPSSVGAHRLMAWAARTGMQSLLAERLFAAHFCDGADLGDPAVLAGIGAEAGLDPAAILRHLAGPDGLDRVQSDNLRAHRRGIGGVPCFVFDSGLAISGAQDPDVFGRLLDVAALDRVPG